MLLIVLSYHRLLFGPVESDDDVRLEEKKDALMNNVVWPCVVRLAKVNSRAMYDVHRANIDGRTALYETCISKMEEGCGLHRLAERLLALGADPNVRERDENMPLLIRMAQYKRVDLFVIKMLLDAGADLCAQDDEGWTFIHELVENHELETLQQMYARLPHYMCQFDYTLMDKDDMTVIHHAKWEATDDSAWGRSFLPEAAYAMVELLIAERAKLYASIRTALHDSTPLKLNADSDLTNIIFSYYADQSEGDAIGLLHGHDDGDAEFESDVVQE